MIGAAIHTRRVGNKIRATLDKQRYTLIPVNLAARDHGHREAAEELAAAIATGRKYGLLSGELPDGSWAHVFQSLENADAGRA